MFVAPERGSEHNGEVQGTFGAGFLLLATFALTFRGRNTNLGEECGARSG